MSSVDFAIRSLPTRTAVVYRLPLARTADGDVDWRTLHQTARAKLESLTDATQAQLSHPAAFVPDDPSDATNKNAHFEVGNLVKDDPASVDAVKRAVAEHSKKPAAEEAKKGSPEGFYLRVLKGGEWANMKNLGDYAHLSQTYGATFTKLKEAGYELDDSSAQGTVYEVYTKYPGEDQEAETEVYVPVRKSA